MISMLHVECKTAKCGRMARPIRCGDFRPAHRAPRIPGASGTRSRARPTTGLRWRRAYLDLTYRSGAYRPYEQLIRDAAMAAQIDPGHADELVRRWQELEPWPEAREVVSLLAQQGAARNRHQLLGAAWPARRRASRRAVRRGRHGGSRRLLQAAARTLSRRARRSLAPSRRAPCSSRDRQPMCRARRASACRSSGITA